MLVPYPLEQEETLVYLVCLVYQVPQVGQEALVCISSPSCLFHMLSFEGIIVAVNLVLPLKSCFLPRTRGSEWS